MPQTKEQRQANLEKGRQTQAAKRAAKQKQVKPKAAPLAPEEDEQLAASFTFQSAPVEPDDGDGVMDAVKKVAKALGIEKTEKEEAPEKGEKAATPAGVTLPKAKREFANALTPIAVPLFIAAMAWLWSRIGPKYKKLAPDKQVASRIVAPLIRIYVRNSKMTAAVSPDAIDLMASMAALAGYAWTAMQLFEQISADEEDEQEEERPHAPTVPYTVQARASNGHDRRDSVQQSDHQDAGDNDPGASLDLSSLSPGERANYLALARLREQDYVSRARRTGRYGQF